MAVIINSHLNESISKVTTYQGNFQALTNKKKSKIADYLDAVYSYPPKVKLKWDALDQFTGDLLIEDNYGVLEHSFPFLDFVEDWFSNSKSQDLLTENYTSKDYLTGYLNKINSANFYNTKTKTLQNALEGIPVFVVLNGNGEIVLNKSSNTLAPKNINSIINEKIYDFCGAFDQAVEKNQQLGFFFLSRLDAEMYLKAIAQSDIDGTQTLGLAINCIGLDSAYKVTREHHPGIDFRFVPDLEEVQNLLSKSIKHSDVIFEDEQQQLRFSPRTANLFPFIDKVGLKVSQFIGVRSFVQRSEYFKGVPIYIVQVPESSRNLFVENYFTTIGAIDSIWSKVVQQPINNLVGMGNNRLLQGSLKEVKNTKNFVNYIFFEKGQASDFIKQHGRKITRYSGANIPQLDPLVKKPKIFVYNLEDFIESWEDAIQTNLTGIGEQEPVYEASKNYFISAPQITKEITNLKLSSQENPVKNIFKALGVKIRVLKRNVGLFITVD